MGKDTHKTPLHYYEVALAEVFKVKEELQAELKEIRQTKSNSSQTIPESDPLLQKINHLEEELQTVKEKIKNDAQDIKELKERIILLTDSGKSKSKFITLEQKLELTKKELAKTKQEVQGLQERLIFLEGKSNKDLEKELESAKEKLKNNAQDIKELKERIILLTDSGKSKSKFITLEQELESTQKELAKTKQELKGLQERLIFSESKSNENKFEIREFKEYFQTNLSQAFNSVFVTSSQENAYNSTSSGSWKTVLSHQLFLSKPSQVNVLAHCHGFAEKHYSPLDIRIFIDDAIFDEGNWGLGITHSPSWQTLICIFIKALTSGKHTIELKYRSRNRKGKVYLNYPSFLISMTPPSN